MTFKVGDKIQRKAGYEKSCYPLPQYTVKSCPNPYGWFRVEGDEDLVHIDYWERVKEPVVTEKKTPHKHAVLIKAWADGAKIEGRAHTNEYWTPIGHPQWHEHWQYRIKPEPKPDIILYATIEDELPVEKSFNKELDFTQYRTPFDNLKLTFDGETGKLKAAEVIA